MANPAIELPRRPTNLHQTARFLKSAVMDLIIVVVAYIVVLSVRITPTIDEYGRTIVFALYAGFVLIVAMRVFGVYRRIWTRTSGHDMTVLVKAVGAASLVLLGINLALPRQPVPMTVILVGNSIALGGFVAVRYRSRLLKSLHWRYRAVIHREFPDALTHTRTLIVGAGESGQALALRLRHRVPGGEMYRLIGFIDDDANKHGMILEGLPILGGRDAIPRIVERYGIELIVFAIHNIDGPSFRNIIEQCEHTKARIKLVPDVLELVNMTNKKGAALLRDVQPEDLIGRTVAARNENVDLSPIIGKIVLVTGAAGSVGSEITRQLIQYKPTRLVLFDNNESALHDLHTELTAKAPSLTITPVLGDITIREHLSAVFQNHHPEVIFHAAAYKHVPMLEHYPGEALRVNVGGTRNVVELAVKNDVERFVLISTDKAVNPSNVMGASKRLCELVMHAYASRATKTLFAAVRFGNVLGSRGSVVPTFNRQIDNGGPVTITHPDMTRYFMSITEAANLVIHAACLTDGDAIFVLNMGEVVRIQDLAERMIRLRGLRPFLDIKIQYTGIRPGEKLHEVLWDESESPRATVHPHILEIRGWDDDFDASQFLHNLDIVLKTRINGERPFADDVEAMAELNRLMQVQVYSSQDTHEKHETDNLRVQPSALLKRTERT